MARDQIVELIVSRFAPRHMATVDRIMPQSEGERFGICPISQP